MGYPTDDEFEHARERRDPPARCGRHACTEHVKCVDACNVCKCPECVVALEAHQRAPVSHDVLDSIARDRMPVDPNQSDAAKRTEIAAILSGSRAANKAHALEYAKHELAAANAYADARDNSDGLYTSRPGPIVGLDAFTPETAPDETTRAMEERTRELAHYRGEHARAVDALGTALPDAADGPRHLAGLTSLAIQRIAKLTHDRDEAQAAAREIHEARDKWIAMCEQANAERNDLQRSLDLVHDADRRGIEMWRAEHPSRALIIPDRAKMIAWLIEENTKLRGRDAEAKAYAPDHKEMIARLHAQLAEVTRQRDAAEQQQRVTQGRLEQFMGALAEMSIERLRMLREREAAPNIHLPGHTSELETALDAAKKEAARRRVRFEECEAACWQAIEMIAPESGLPFYSERNVDVEVAVKTIIVGLLKEINSLREVLARTQALTSAASVIVDVCQRVEWPSPLIANAFATLKEAHARYAKSAPTCSADPSANDTPF